MSDLKLSELTAEERAIVDHQAFRYHADWTPESRYRAALNYCEPMILYRRALFAPAKDEATTESYSQVQPTPPSEMPEAVHPVARAIDALITASEYYEDEESIAVCVQAAEDLELWWRSQPAPALRMTEEWWPVIHAAENWLRQQKKSGLYETGLPDAIAAVRASQPQGVELPKVREALITLSGCIYMQENMDKVIAALAELDAAEGKVTG